MKRCLKEWNATVEALGHGKQTILIRTYKTFVPNFLLYPTTNYTLNDDYLSSFQTKYHSFVEENSSLTTKNGKIEIKYYANVDDIIEIPLYKIKSLQKYYIWTQKHVKSYLKRKNAFIWILRVYKLKKPHMTVPLRSIKFANLKKEIPLKDMKPILSDSEFLNIVEKINLFNKGN